MRVKITLACTECKQRNYNTMKNKKNDPDMSRVPLWKKMNLTVEEAAEYSGIGVSKIKEISNQKNCPFVLWNGTKRLIKRKQFEDYLETQYSV